MFKTVKYVVLRTVFEKNKGIKTKNNPDTNVFQIAFILM